MSNSKGNNNIHSNGQAVAEHPEKLPLNGSAKTASDQPESRDFHASHDPSHDACGMTDSLGPPLPPDGGYGWMILFASFIINVIVDGVCFSFGIFYLEFLDYYGESKAKTSWVGSVLNGMYLTMGPIVSALANKFGCRAVTIVGSIIATAAYIGSTFSTNIDMLILFYGAIGGIGFGLMYLPAIVMVGFYFEKRRAFATGIAVCGSGIGAFVFAPMCEKLLQVYNWKGATWIVAGLVLNGVVMGALFRPLEASRPKSKCRKEHKQDIDSSTPDERKCLEYAMDDLEEDNLSPKEMISPVDSTDPKALLHAKMKNNVNKELAGISDSNLKAQTCIQSCHDLHTSSKVPLTSLHKNYSSKSLNDLVAQQEEDEQKEREVKNYERPLYRKDIFYSGSVQHLSEFKSNQDMASYVKSVTSIPDDIPPEKQGVLWNFLRAFKSMTDTLREMMDFSLLKNPVFVLYGLSCFLCMTGFFVPFTFLPDHAISQGCTRDQSAFLLSIIGIANTVARVLTGFVSDQPWADPIIINNCALIIGGIATCLTPYCYNYGLLAAYSATFGSCIAAFVSLRSIIMVELMGLDKLTNAFGLVTMCQGLSAFIGAPIAGALYDATGDYKYSFFMAGGTLAAAGIICIPLRPLARWYKEQELKKSGLSPTVNSKEKPLIANQMEAGMNEPVEL